MGNKNKSQEPLIKAVKGEQLYEMATEEPELSESESILEAMEAVVKANPQFKNKTLIQLKRNLEFRRKVKEYRLNNPLSANAEAIEILKSVIPKKHVKPNNKLANTITDEDIIDDGAFSLIVSPKNAKKEVATKVMLAYDNRKIQLSGQKYTPYDREVYDGVVTLYEAGNNIITPGMVYRAMNGLTETEFVSPQALEAVTKSLDKSRFIRTSIDYTDEASMYNKKFEKTTYEGYLLNAEKITVEIKGEKHEGYKIFRKPILYEYAQISGQIISVPIKVLQTKNAVRRTDEVIIVRGYLLRQIEWMRNTNTTRSDVITYQKIYEELDISKFMLDAKAYEKKTAKVRSHIKAILDEWKEQGYIIDYTENKDGNKLTGIKIML